VSLSEAGIEPSVGSVGDSYDNAMVDSVIGLLKSEVVKRSGPWRGLEDVEFATLEWTRTTYNGFSSRLAMSRPMEFEALYYQRQQTPALSA